MVSVDSQILIYFLEFEEAFELRIKGKFDEAISEYDSILERAHEDLEGVNGTLLKNITSMGCSYKGDSYRAAGGLERAIFEFSASLAFAGDNFVKALALEFKGIYETQFGDKEQAVKDHEESLKLYTEAGHLEKMARMHSVLGASYIRSKDYEKAEKHLKDAINITKDIIEKLRTWDSDYKFYSMQRAMSTMADAIHRNGERLTLIGTKDSLKQSVDEFDQSIDMYSERLKDEGRAAVVSLRKAYALSLLDNKEECFSAYHLFLKGLNDNIVQPAALKVIQPQVDAVDKYLKIEEMIPILD